MKRRMPMTVNGSRSRSRSRSRGRSRSRSRGRGRGRSCSRSASNRRCFIILGRGSLLFHVSSHAMVMPMAVSWTGIRSFIVMGMGSSWQCRRICNSHCHWCSRGHSLLWILDMSMSMVVASVLAILYCHQCDFGRKEVLEKVEGVIQGLVTSLGNSEAPALSYPSRTTWQNVRCVSVDWNIYLIHGVETL